MRDVPLHPEEEKSDLQQQSEPNTIPVTVDSRAHVLVVEDQPQMARMIAATLTTRYRVTIASDGQEGLEQALALRPDIILCDVLMPRMNGEQLVTVLRAQPDFDDVPIVVLSGHTDEQLRIQLLRAGAQDFLVKPFHYEELQVRVANLLMMRQVPPGATARGDTAEPEPGRPGQRGCCTQTRKRAGSAGAAGK